jgi:CRP-like cAMP-binding protein
MPLRPKEFLQCLSAEERQKLMSLGTIQRVDEGQVLMERGEESDRVLVVLAGEVHITRDGVEVAVRGPGAIIGEMAIVDHQPRSASVVAMRDGEILTIPANKFRAFIGRSPQASLAVIESLGRRLREQTARR